MEDSTWKQVMIGASITNSIRHLKTNHREASIAQPWPPKPPLVVILMPRSTSSKNTVTASIGDIDIESC